MHGAPSVSHPVGRSSFAAWVVCGVWLAAATASIAWGLAGAPTGRVLLAGGLTLVAGVLAAWSWWKEPAGTLSWDGGRWTWSTAQMPLGQEGTLSVVVDLQRCLLVHWRCASGRRWFWLQQADSRDQWVALRRAVYSRADGDSPSGAEPPPSSTP
jgi:toxin CptA